MHQPHRGLVETALGAGVDISRRHRPALRAARGVQPRLPVGRRRGDRSRAARGSGRWRTRSTARERLHGGVTTWRADYYALRAGLADGGADAQRAARGGRGGADRRGAVHERRPHVPRRHGDLRRRAAVAARPRGPGQRPDVRRARRSAARVDAARARPADRGADGRAHAGDLGDAPARLRRRSGPDRGGGRAQQPGAARTRSTATTSCSTRPGWPTRPRWRRRAHG